MRANAHAGSWLFPEGVAFPIVSADLHPLKLHARGLAGRAVLSAVLLHFVIFGAWLIQRGLATGDIALPDVPGPQTVIPFLILPPPPPIEPDAASALPQVKPDAVISAASGDVEPVPDFLAPDALYESPEDWVKRMTPIVQGDGGTGTATFVIDPKTLRDEEPDPGDFIPVEEEPYAIQSPAPVYPEMARAAEVEGTVVVRALVNKAGRIEKAFVVSGHPMLDDAALAAVRAWVFRPAMQQHQPVKVWVMVPIRFVLH